MSTTLFMYYFTYSNSAFVSAKVIYGSNKSTVVFDGATGDWSDGEGGGLLLVPSPPPLIPPPPAASSRFLSAVAGGEISSPARSWSEEHQRENLWLFFHLRFSEILKRWAFVIRVSDAVLQYGQVSLRNFICGELLRARVSSSPEDLRMSLVNYI